jgi:hypothetical protein
MAPLCRKGRRSLECPDVARAAALEQVAICDQNIGNFFLAKQEFGV